MKKKMRRLICFTLALFLVLSLLPTSALAEETADQTTTEKGIAYFASETEQVLGEGRIEGSVTRKPVYAEKDNGYYTDVEEAIALLRERMVDRRSVIEIPLRVSKADAASVGGLQALIEVIFAMAAAHTGVEDQGDYLLWSVAKRGYNATYTETNSYYYLDIPYEFTYYTTLEQEVSVGRKLDSIFTSFGFTEQTDDYTKIKTIYDYICANVTYDYANLENDAYTLKYTAYAALNNGTAVCQGYATLLYRMLLRAGIDCRVITGVDDTNEGHAWNIVALDGRYYNMDSTWDAGYDEYEYFLRGTTDFPDHFRDATYDSADFHALYPMAALGYAGGEAQVVAQGTCGEGVNWVLMSDGILTVSGTGAMKEYWPRDGVPTTPWANYCGAITSAVINSGVTSIGGGAFSKCSNLTNISIPDTVTSIGVSAFLSCTSLGEVDIPDSVTSIEDHAFSGCTGLVSITIPDSVKEIKYRVFGNCTSLTEITIPDSVTSMGADTFEGCKMLSSVKLSNNITKIGPRTFYGCTSLTSITIPDNVTSIEDFAFYNCTSLNDLTIPDSVTSIGRYAFHATNLSNIILPTSVTAIGNGAFYSCKNLSSVTIGGKLTIINDEVFGKCSSLTGITIPDTVTAIGHYAFEGCSALTEITVPDSVTAIDGWAFTSCHNLAKVTFVGNAPSISSCAFSIVTATAYYPAGNPTWTTEVMQDYGGDITWVPVCATHTPVTVPGKAATCTEPGLTDGKKCTTCGVTTVAQQTIPAKGHSFENGVCMICGEKDPNFKPDGLLGDADGSGVVDYVDAMLVLQYHTGVITNEALTLAQCDVDGSGAVDYVDAMRILQYHTGVISGF